MSYSVLILDDDADFNSLLTDIFEQADYSVTSLTDPVEGVEVFRNSKFDLVVTDHKMPEMSGAEFMREVKLIRAEVPVIMVSGYLENETIRELISEGVGGVFLKPLNIFSLLERTRELIEDAKKHEQAPQDAEESDSASKMDTKLGFNFRSFPCKTGASTAFAERLHFLRNFRSTLTLMGEKGMHFRAICEDIKGFYDSDAEQFIYLTADSFDRAQTIAAIEEAKEKGAERVTCVLLDVIRMSDAQKKLAVALSKVDGEFSDPELGLRAIYCVSGDLDQLLDDGLIDENLYILMGTAEVSIPPLRECNIDVGVMAQQLIVEIARSKALSVVPRLEKAARDLLLQQRWEGNYDELRATIEKMMDSDPGDVLTLSDAKTALGLNLAATPRAKFESYLSSQQVDFVRAATILFKGDTVKAAKLFQSDVDQVSATLK